MAFESTLCNNSKDSTIFFVVCRLYFLCTKINTFFLFHNCFVLRHSLRAMKPWSEFFLPLVWSWRGGESKSSLWLFSVVFFQQITRESRDFFFLSLYEKRKTSLKFCYFFSVFLSFSLILLSRDCPYTRVAAAEGYPTEDEPDEQVGERVHHLCNIIVRRCDAAGRNLKWYSRDNTFYFDLFFLSFDCEESKNCAKKLNSLLSGCL